MPKKMMARGRKILKISLVTGRRGRHHPKGNGTNTISKRLPDGTCLISLNSYAGSGTTVSGNSLCDDVGTGLPACDTK